MLRNTLSYKFSTFMGAFCTLGTVMFFAIQEVANGRTQGLVLSTLIALIVLSDVILFILIIIDFFNRKKLKPAKITSQSKSVCEIVLIMIYLITSGILLWIVSSIIFFKP